MELTIKGEHGFEFKAKNPDERLSGYFMDRVKEAYDRETLDFLQEVAVEFRKLEPGKTIEIKSRPLVITLSKPMEESPATNRESGK